MGEPQTFEYTLATNEWWWIGSILFDLLSGSFGDTDIDSAGFSTSSEGTVIIFSRQTDKPLAQHDLIEDTSPTKIMTTLVSAKKKTGEIIQLRKLRSLVVCRAVVTGGEKTTLITVTALPQYKELIPRQVIRNLESICSTAKSIRQESIGIALEEVLDEYYAIQATGKRAKLRDLAQKRRVNYASLRQAKIRYDAKRKQNETEQDKNASDD